jgi:tetratricopeptide (TPR) repeat protein
VNADPADVALRVKLGEAYARKGMFREAEDELARAREAGADVTLIAAAQGRIQAMRSAETAARAIPPRPGSRVSMTNGKSFNGAPATSIAKMVEGDKLWNSGKPDEAADAYKESVKLNPNDWRAHERLAVVDASMSLFGESRKALDELAKVQPKPPPSVVANRYEMLRGYFDKHFTALVRQYETTGADFEKKIITRESYYNAVKGLALRLESMASFLDAVTAPSAKKPAHLRRSLACGLMAQAASSLLDYLETNAAKSKTNAEIFANQAKSETQAAAKLDENKVIVEKEPAPQPPPEPSPSEQPPPEQPPPNEPPPSE